VEGEPAPLGDLEAFHAECLFADLEVVERRIERAKKERAAPQEIAAFEREELGVVVGPSRQSFPAEGGHRVCAL